MKIDLVKFKELEFADKQNMSVYGGGGDVSRSFAFLEDFLRAYTFDQIPEQNRTIIKTVLLEAGILVLDECDTPIVKPHKFTDSE